MERPQERRGRPPSFTRAELVTAARELGPDAISLPTVAARLGVARTSLYWHVRDVDELGEAVLLEIFETEAPRAWEPTPGRSWSDELASFARSTRDRLIAAGGWIRFATPSAVLGRAQLGTLESLVTTLRRCGFAADEAADAFAYVFQVALANVGKPEAPVAEIHGVLVGGVDGVARAEFPMLHELAEAAARARPDARFSYQLDCSLRGIAARCGVPLGVVPNAD